MSVRLPAAALVIATWLAVTLTACGSGKQKDDIEARLQELEEANSSHASQIEDAADAAGEAQDAAEQAQSDADDNQAEVDQAQWDAQDANDTAQEAQATAEEAKQAADELMSQ